MRSGRKPRKERLAARKARQIQSTKHKQLRALDGVAGEAKIPDIGKSVAAPLQQDEIRRSPRRIARIEHKRSRAPVHESRNKTPIRDAGIVAKVVADFAAATQAKLGDEVEPHVVGEHVADGVKVAGVEAIDISGETRALSFSQGGNRRVVGLLGDLAKTRTAAMERCFHRRNG